MFGARSKSSRPGSLPTPRSWLICGLATSPSTSSTDVSFASDAECEIERHERLALAGHGARDHDEVAAFDAILGATESLLDQRTLDATVLALQLTILMLRRQQTGHAQRGLVDRNGAGRHRQLARRRRVLLAAGGAVSALHRPKHPVRIDLSGRVLVSRAALGLQLLQCILDDAHGGGDPILSEFRRTAGRNAQPALARQA